MTWMLDATFRRQGFSGMLNMITQADRYNTFNRRSAEHPVLQSEACKHERRHLQEDPNAS